VCDKLFEGWSLYGRPPSALVASRLHPCALSGVLATDTHVCQEHVLCTLCVERLGCGVHLLQVVVAAASTHQHLRYVGATLILFLVVRATVLDCCLYIHVCAASSNSIRALSLSGMDFSGHLAVKHLVVGYGVATPAIGWTQGCCTAVAHSAQQLPQHRIVQRQ
jgi:hypothetical protein